MENDHNTLRESLLSPGWKGADAGSNKLKTPVSRMVLDPCDSTDNVDLESPRSPVAASPISPMLQHVRWGSTGTIGENDAIFREENDSADDSEIPRLVHWVNNVLFQLRKPLILATVLLLWPLGFFSFIQFQHLTDSTFHPAKGSPSDLAIQAFREAYHHQSTHSEVDWSDPMNPPLVLLLEEQDSNHRQPTTITSRKTTADPKNPAVLHASPMTHDPRSASFRAGKKFSDGLLDYLIDPKHHCWKWPGETDCDTTTNWLKVTSYYSLVDQELQWMADSMKSPSGETALITVQYIVPQNQTHHRNQRIVELMYAIDSYKEQFFAQQTSQEPLFSVRYTGIKYFSSDLLLSTRRDLARMDVIVLPLALLLIGLVLPSANPAYIWIIPVTTILTTVSCWSIIMWMIASLSSMQISTFTPTVMMSLSLGMGIDYTLFLLARYLEERTLQNKNKRSSILHMLAGSGHVLLLSGLTLAATFLGLVFLPLSMLQSIGLGAAVAIGSALAVNLTLVPALLHTHLGDKLVAKSIPENQPLPTLEGTGSTNESLPNSNLKTSLLPNEISNGENNNQNNHVLLSCPPPQTPQIRSFWRRLSKHLLHPYKGIIVLMITCQLLYPVAQHAGRIKSSISFDLMLPSKSPSLIAFHDLGKKLGGGRLNPYRILFDGHAANMVMTSDRGFEVMHLVVDELRAIDQTDDEYADAQTHVGPITGHDEFASLSALVFDQMNHRPVEEETDDSVLCEDAETNSTELCFGRRHAVFNGISVLQNTRIPHGIFTSAKYCSQLKPYCPLELPHVLNEIDKASTSDDLKATFITATLMNTSPFSDRGIDWLKEARATIDRLERGNALQGVKVHIEGSAGIAHDAVDAVYQAFPSMIIITTLIVFLLMGIFFKSVFPPLRSVISIAITLAVSFGLAVRVFQDGVLNDWTSFRILVAAGGEMCWLVPIMAFSIIVGLALDYDVFLISRILEYRLQSYEHKTSIANGLHSTGSIITVAGLIMAVAFGSLMFSSNPVLYQWSFLLTTAVLLDTFVIRSIIVPILTNLAGPKLSWWPRRLPPSHICLSEYQPRSNSDSDIAGLLQSLEETSEYEPLRPTTA